MQTVHTQHSLKERQRREREALILQVAEEVLQERGYYDTSMDEIAARVGISKGTIYGHFPGKEELVVAIFTRDLQALLEGIDVVIASAATPRAQLEALLEFIFNGMITRHTQLIASIYNGVDMKRMMMAKGGCLKELWDVLTSRVTVILEEGKKVGEFKQSIPTRVMLFSFFSHFSPRSYDQLILGEDLSPNELINYLKEVYFSGIAVSVTDAQ